MMACSMRLARNWFVSFLVLFAYVVATAGHGAEPPRQKIDRVERDRSAQRNHETRSRRERDARERREKEWARHRGADSPGQGRTSRAEHGLSRKDRHPDGVRRQARGQYRPPEKAVAMERYVREHQGRPREGYVGGMTWNNRRGDLPPEGQYREYDVNRYTGKNRGAERIVRDVRSQRAWYTRDHYETFSEIRRH